MNEKRKLGALLEPEFMSSEDSDVDDEGKKIFLLRPLPWRSDRANAFIEALDKKVISKASARSKQMRYTRVSGLASDRPKPSVENSNEWIVK